MRLHRFYISQPLGEEVVIDEVSLVSQWTKVLRFEIGDFVILFNGDGYDHRYAFVSLSKKSCVLSRVQKEPSYIPAKETALYLSLIKKDKFELVAEKATELGVTSIIPVISERSLKKELSMERLRRIVIEAAEQSGRGSIPIIYEPLSLKEAVSTLDSAFCGMLFSTEKGVPAISESAFAQQKNAIFIGPEGGWSGGDLEIMNAYSKYSLGKTILRAETAAIAACVFANLAA